MTTQIATRAYELYEQQGYRDGQSVQNWDKAEREIQENQAKADPETQAEPKPEVKAEAEPENKVEATPEIKVEPQPETKTVSRPEAKAEPKPEDKAETPSDLTPQIVKRVHDLYEELGRKDLQAVEDLEKAERETRKDQKGHKDVA